MAGSGMEGRSVVVVEGARTPFAKAGLELANLSAVDLGVLALQEAVARAEIKYNDIDEVIVGNVCQPPEAANIARVIALFAGVPKNVPAYSVQRNCASGMEAVFQGQMLIATGQADTVVAGGTESMSQIPLLMTEELKKIFFGVVMSKSLGKKFKALSAFKGRYLKPIIGLELGLTDPVSGLIMGKTAENLARDFGISREEQDDFALKSHQKAVDAAERLKDEIVPAYPPKYKSAVDVDKGPRKTQTIEALAKLKPYFERKHGTVTVGNACPVTDGSAMMVLMAEDKAKAEGYPILGRLKSFAFSGCEPSRMGLGPAFASPKALKSAGLKLSDMDLVEINEAFAAQVIACLKAFGSKEWAAEHLGESEATGEIDPDKLNVNGGAIAIGHPVGATGTRLILTALHELKRRNKNLGLATLCIGGGQGGACVVERVN